MPYLDWKDSAVQLTLEPHARLGSDFGVGIEAASIPALVELLVEIFQGERVGRELRVDLPRNWLLFWKARESESRLLIAHPQAEVWVGTLALEASDAALLLERLRCARAGDVVKVSEIFAVGGVSNFELTIRVG